MSELSDWIRTHCFTRKGTFNNRCCLESWWHNRNCHEKLVEIKNFFPSDNVLASFYHAYRNDREVGRCARCASPTNFINFKEGYAKYCSVFCVTQSPERNRKIAEHRDYNEIFRKMRQTNLTKYGVEHYYQSDDFKRKSAQTKFDRYGDSSYNNVELRRANCFQKHGVDDLFKLSEHQLYLKQKRIEKYGYSHQINYTGSESQAEKNLREFLNSTGFDFKKNKKLLQTKEIDAYCDELKLGVEYCGLYWHSEEKKPNAYHYDKMKACNERGVRLITIFEDEWLYRNKQVKQFLKATMGVFEKRLYARDCNVIEIDKILAKRFLNEHHIQGRPNRISRVFGLIHDDELLGVVSFGLHHRNNKDQVLNRLAFVDGIQVVGGASKIIKYAIKQMNVPIITWSDNRWTEGALYQKVGFVLETKLPPDYSYIQGQKRIPKQSMKKKDIGCPDEMTEHEFCLSKKIYRIYDCGKKRWLYKGKE